MVEVFEVAGVCAINLVREGVIEIVEVVGNLAVNISVILVNENSEGNSTVLVRIVSNHTFIHVDLTPVSSVKVDLNDN